MMRRRALAIAWAAAMVLVLAALGLQIVYADGTRRCLEEELSALCQGPLDAWVTPITLIAGGVLVGLGLWLIVPTRGGGSDLVDA